jgi:hypothetical protein
MVVTLELKDVAENPSIVKRYLERGDQVQVVDQGQYVFDAVDPSISEEEPDHSNDAYFASEILKTEQLEREGKLEYLSEEEFLEWMDSSLEEVLADVPNQTQ